jgi:hypothetical protein
MIRVALGLGHHTLGLRIVDDGLFGLVPLELATKNIRQIAQNAQIGHADSGFDVHNRLGAWEDAGSALMK